MLDEALIGVVLLDLRLVHSTELQFRARALHWQPSQRTNSAAVKSPGEIDAYSQLEFSSVQFSSATHARCGGTFNVRLTTNLPRNLLVKNFFESVKIWQNYGRESVAHFLWPTLYVVNADMCCKQGFSFFTSKRLADKNVSEMTCFFVEWAFLKVHPTVSETIFSRQHWCCLLAQNCHLAPV